MFRHKFSFTKFSIFLFVTLHYADGIVRNVLHVPGLGTNLISIVAVTKLGLTVDFLKNKVFFRRNNNPVMIGERVGVTVEM